MILEETRIGDLIKLQRGHDLPSSKRVKGSIPIISSSGITDYHNKYKADGEGVVTGRYGTLGDVFYVNGKYWPLNTALYVKDFKGNFPKFIFYFLKTLHLERFNGAAAVPGLDRNVIHKLKVKVPIDLPTQKKIASILSAYDDLIENNNQRIQLLEEMAEEIYKEWFVRMRVPGYKKAKFYDKEGNEVPHGTEGAIPEGWEYKRLSEEFSYNRGKSYSSNDLSEPDENCLPLLNLKNVNRNGGFRKDGTKGFKGKYSEKNVAKSEDVIMAVTDMTQSRDIVGRVARVPENGLDKFIFSMDLINIKPKKFSLDFTYSFFKFSGIGLLLKEFANGANVLHLTPDVAFRQKALLPNYEIANLFSERVKPFFKEIDILEMKNQILQETRDLLLPRLISGKLDVSELEIKSEELLNQAAEPVEGYK